MTAGVGYASGVQLHNIDGNDPTMSPADTLFKTLHDQLDSKIDHPDGVFVPLMQTILKGSNVVKFEGVEGEQNTFRMTLQEPMIAENESAWYNKGKTFLLEKTILMQIVPEKLQVIYPKVKAIYDAAPEPENPDESKYVKLTPEQVKSKNLESIWAWESYLGLVYTGVNYSSRWDHDEKKLISDNINDAPKSIQSLATPRIKTLEDTLKEWNERSRKPANQQ